MNSTTLRGIFPEPKPVYRRNFVKENVKSIKHMQGLLQEAGVIQHRKRPVPNRLKYNSLKTSTSTRSLGNLDVIQPEARGSSKSANVPIMKNQPSQPVKDRPIKRDLLKSRGNAKMIEDDNSRLTHRGMQTEREEDLSRLYETGVIKYPSPGVIKSPVKDLRKQRTGQGDEISDYPELVQGIETLTTDDKDFIKENKTIKPRTTTKQSPTKVMGQAPPNYQRGVVPKYLRDRKDDTVEELDTDCPPGHILLPEDERKETLRVLRQSYADRIQELNMMPVRNDTLKMRKRKMEIEEELKRIDGGIKVFQRPKVYVKINA